MSDSNFLSPDDPCTSSSLSANPAGPNLRKMILRQPVPPSATPARDALSPTTPIDELHNLEAETTSSDGVSQTLDVRKRKQNPWSFDEVSAFYEGIKIHGKDFDSVVKVMLKRKIVKTKEHVKTFFFNSVKTYKTMLNISDDDLAMFPKDARELFILLNACEWKRRTMHTKVNNEKLRELIMEGTVNLKMNRKTVTIKTPPCPALCRYFSCRKADKIPNEMIVHLEPTGNDDHVFMRNRNYNPFLRVKLNANDRIIKLLDFLSKKWGAEEDSPISVTLWPDSSCEITSLIISTVETSPFISLSLNKLKKHLEEAKEKIEPKKTTGMQLATEANTKTKPSYNVYYPKPFTLTDAILAEGINLQNINQAILAELFCVCGRKNPIQLRYRINYVKPRQKAREPWKIMIGLLNRGFGDTLAPTRQKEAETASRAPMSKKRKAGEETPYHLDQNEPYSDLVVPAARENLETVGSAIVEEENEAFEYQLAMLRKTQRKRNVPANRKYGNAPAVISTGTPPIFVAPSVAGAAPAQAPQAAAPAIKAEQLPHQQKEEFTAPSCTIIPRKVPGKAPTKAAFARKMISGTGPSTSNSSIGSISSSRGPIDFANIGISPIKKKEVSSDAELLRRRTNEVLSSLRTPVDTPVQTPRKQLTMMQQLFGDDLSMSPGSTRHAPSEVANSSVVDFTDMMYQGILDQTDMTISNPGLHFSPNEVHKQFQDMMSSSQDSHDYVWQQFKKKKLLTPKKGKK